MDLHNKFNKMTQFHIGCSGFYYRHWKGSFYPEDLAQSKWFNFYAEHFKALELNVTFYRFPELKTLQGWHKKSPEDFKFIVKANRLITHYKKFNDVDEPLHNFYKVVNEGLAEKCGGILFQMPPSYHYSPEALEKITSQLNPEYHNILEFRHTSWWQQDVYYILGQHGITFCGISHPTLPETVICNNENLYYRFHGNQKLYDSDYADQELQHIFDKIINHQHLKEAYLFFNNDIHTYAINNAKKIQEFLKKI